MLFEMLSGRLPFVGSTAGDLIVMHITREAPDLGYFAPSVSTGMTSLVARMLAKEPSERPNMSAVEEELAQIERRVQAGTAISTRTRRRRLLLLRWGGIAAVALGGTAGLWQIQKQRVRPVALPAAVERVPITTPAAAPLPQALTQVAASAAAAAVSWTVRTVPAGAKVVRTADQVQLGTTPWQQSVPRGEGNVEVSVELPGFSPQQATLAYQHDTAWDLKLQAVLPDKRPLGDAVRGRHGTAERPRERNKPVAAAPPPGQAPAPAAAAPLPAPPVAAPPSSAPLAAKPQPEQPRDDDIEVPALH